MPDARLLLWGETQVGKTTLLATGLLSHPDRLPAIDWNADKDDAIAVLLREWADLSRNLTLQPTARATDLTLPLANGNRLLVRDIVGGHSVNPYGEETFRVPAGTALGVLFVIEWEGRDLARHKAAIRSALPLCRGRRIGLAVTKSERGLDADDPHWRAPPGWWREHACWGHHAELLEPFGAQVWPTSAYGFDADGRPACLLGEFGQLIPFQVRPRNVEVPFRWFFRELGLL